MNLQPSSCAARNATTHSENTAKYRAFDHAISSADQSFEKAGIFSHSSFLVICNALSATETQKSRSSMVAINVGSFPLHLICVITFLASFVVLIDRPVGVLKLSGETAFAMAAATFASLYFSIISASNLVAFQLFSN
jgi:hypothetical protein